jgi:hypothetical protein
MGQCEHHRSRGKLWIGEDIIGNGYCSFTEFAMGRYPIYGRFLAPQIWSRALAN